MAAAIFTTRLARTSPSDLSGRVEWSCGQLIESLQDHSPRDVLAMRRLVPTAHDRECVHYVFDFWTIEAIEMEEGPVEICSQNPPPRRVPNEWRAVEVEVGGESGHVVGCVRQFKDAGLHPRRDGFTGRPRCRLLEDCRWEHWQLLRDEKIQCGAADFLSGCIVANERGQYRGQIGGQLRICGGEQQRNLVPNSRHRKCRSDQGPLNCCTGDVPESKKPCESIGREAA